ncbi:MAG: hypothetical protein JKX78_13535 [Alteromonadaceae bacterium]|nr:hypothetical protein [Alteromonadaceae bacterium]
MHKKNNKNDYKMDFSTEELDFFNGLFSADIAETQQELMQKNLTVTTSVPSNIANILGSAKTSLLVELGFYQLWFPLSIGLNDCGEFTSIIGSPEIVDNQLNERSWRVSAPKNISLSQQGIAQNVEILSLSSSGLTMRATSDNMVLKSLKDTELDLHLSDFGSIKVALEKVRSYDDVLAVKFKKAKQENEHLRKFLFNLHRSENADLYQNTAMN